MWYRGDWSGREDEEDVGDPRPAFYQSAGRIHRQQTNTQVRDSKPLSVCRVNQCNSACLSLIFALSMLSTICICYIAIHRIASTPLHLRQVCMRWSSCCTDAVASFTWGVSASWKTSHLPN